MSRDFTDVLITPILSEKSMKLKDKENRYSFRVNPLSNKFEIKAAVEALFKVKVEAVRTANMPGKMHRVGRSEGKRPDWKKAVVTVKAGQKIDTTDLPK
ncbi:MAG: 50S ribosomal protein L23 [Elusimicrobia bacterium GWC2_51_8]|nr:MAG: 50S ribosomal protein L23 [Elusimicrobia bacterium GWA2_51_34]OGR66172.1 MAG: 50S ribosomal protein L23 [Elusimicrobia bacterium GWC2_51_8]OGR85975.1 MAG: 50S ribosomal protein L23 [Elusimicrobia bacterium GWF2_52_66]HAF96464.1 50S ribosomal protein L23 [Elusimicrobiota bacterium]HCE97300.1 50S ribosomal protein L23 [Elusimicrobiota bacterium]